MQAAGGTPLNDGPPEDQSLVSPRPRRRLGVLFAVVVVGWLADLATKTLALDVLSDGRVIQVIPSVLNFRLVRNPGAAFGVGAAYTPILAVLMVIVVIVVLRIARRLRHGPWAIALGLLLAGALGNLTDRIVRAPGLLHGEVIDFLQLPNWPVFNIADMMICAAAALIVLLTLRGRRVDGTRDGADVSEAPGKVSEAPGKVVPAGTDPTAVDPEPVEGDAGPVEGESEPRGGEPTRREDGAR